MSCTDWDLDRTNFIQVLTIGASEIGIHSALLLGDIENNRNEAQAEVGFLIAETPIDSVDFNFQNSNVSVVLSDLNSASDGNEAFIATVEDLKGGTEYEYRAFLRLLEDESVQYGEIRSFTTVGERDKFFGFYRGGRNCDPNGSWNLSVFEVQIEADIQTASGILLNYVEPNRDHPGLAFSVSWTGTVHSDTLIINQTMDEFCQRGPTEGLNVCGVTCNWERSTLKAQAILNGDILSFNLFNLVVIDTRDQTLACVIDCTMDVFKR